MIDEWFPTAIYRVENLFPKEQNDTWAEYIQTNREEIPSGGKGWLGNMYNTFGVYELTKDKTFFPLVNKINKHVIEYSKSFGSMAMYTPLNAWVNIAGKNNYQEYHVHNNSIFSCAYYLTSPVGCGNIVFESPSEPDMMMPKNIVNLTKFNRPTCSYEPKQGMLLIFRSYLRHMVQHGTNEKDRISISMNFI